MSRPAQTNAQMTAAIVVLLTLTGIMVLSMVTKTPPHPPLEIPPFALGPFFGASLAFGFAALSISKENQRLGAFLAALFAVTALVSFGPQKYFDPAFSRIWPAVITAQIAAIAVFFCNYRIFKTSN